MGEPQHYEEVDQHQQQFHQEQDHHHQQHHSDDDHEEEPSLFNGLESHVCYRVQLNPNYERKVKLTNHGNKLAKRLLVYSQNHQFWQRFTATGLAPLIQTGHTIVDHELLFAFAERWHQETSSFHLPFGEMTITLDDISCLLHLPLVGRYYRVTTDQTVRLAVTYLGVTEEEARVECRLGQGPYYRFTWLQDIVVASSRYANMTPGVRAMILLVLSWSIFTVKTYDRAEAKWLLLLEDLTAVGAGSYAWGVWLDLLICTTS